MKATKLNRRLQTAAGLALALLAAAPVQARTIQLGRAYDVAHPSTPARGLTSIDTAQWPAASLEALLQDLMRETEEKGDDRSIRLAAAQELRAALRAGDYQDATRGIADHWTFQAPAQDFPGAACWDPTAATPSLILAKANGTIVRLGLDGQETLLAVADQGIWRTPLLDETGPATAQCQVRVPVSLRVDPAGAIEFLKDGVQGAELYRIAPEGAVSRVWTLTSADVQRALHSDRHFPYVADASMAVAPDGTRYLALPHCQIFRVDESTDQPTLVRLTEQPIRARDLKAGPQGQLLYKEAGTGRICRLAKVDGRWKEEVLTRSEQAPILNHGFQDESGEVLLVEGRTRLLRNLGGSIRFDLARVLPTDTGASCYSYPLVPIPGGVAVLGGTRRVTFLPFHDAPYGIAPLLEKVRLAQAYGSQAQLAGTLEALRAARADAEKLAMTTLIEQGLEELPDDVIRQHAVRDHLQDPGLPWKLALAQGDLWKRWPAYRP